MKSELRFRIKLPSQEVTDRLAFYYVDAVRRRGRECILDDATCNHIVDLALYLTQENPKLGVMLLGDCGNGKSTLMFSFQQLLNALSNSGHFKTFLDHDFKTKMRIYDANELADICNDPKTFAEIKYEWMLGIDDFGEEPAEFLDFGNPRYPLTRLLEFRYAHRLFTFITTNLTDADAIEMRYGKRILDRIMEMFEMIYYDPGSYRLV